MYPHQGIPIERPAQAWRFLESIQPSNHTQRALTKVVSHVEGVPFVIVPDKSFITFDVIAPAFEGSQRHLYGRLCLSVTSGCDLGLSIGFPGNHTSHKGWACALSDQWLDLGGGLWASITSRAGEPC
jgi:hypothetical protein